MIFLEMNVNSYGHRGNGVIGPLLTDEQRWAIVE